MIASQILMMENIIHGNCDLLTDLLEEFQVRFAIGLFLHTRKSHGSQASYSRGQRNEAKRVHAVLLHAMNDLRPALLSSDIRYKDGLLRSPDQSGGTLFDRAFVATHEIGRHIRLNAVQSHRVTSRIVQGQGDKILRGPIPDPFIKGGHTRKVPFSLAIPPGSTAASIEAVLNYALIPMPKPALKDKYLATLATDKERENANMIFNEYTQPRLLTYRVKSL